MPTQANEMRARRTAGGAARAGALAPVRQEGSPLAPPTTPPPPRAGDVDRHAGGYCTLAPTTLSHLDVITSLAAPCSSSVGNTAFS